MLFDENFTVSVEAPSTVTKLEGQHRIDSEKAFIHAERPNAAEDFIPAGQRAGFVVLRNTCPT